MAGEQQQPQQGGFDPVQFIIMQLAGRLISDVASSAVKGGASWVKKKWDENNNSSTGRPHVSGEHYIPDAWREQWNWFEGWEVTTHNVFYSRVVPAYPPTRGEYLERWAVEDDGRWYRFTFRNTLHPSGDPELSQNEEQFGEPVVMWPPEVPTLATVEEHGWKNNDQGGRFYSCTGLSQEGLKITFAWHQEDGIYYRSTCLYKENGTMVCVQKTPEAPPTA